MRPAGRLSAAIDILAALASRSAGAAVDEWGRTHRFAGSKDRRAIADLVFHVLRHRATLAWKMGRDDPRSLALAAFFERTDSPPEALAAELGQDSYGPGPIPDDELTRLMHPPPEPPPAKVEANMPEWALARLQSARPHDAIDQARALAARAPVDLRVNGLKTSVEKTLRRLHRFAPQPGPHCPTCIRIASGTGETARHQLSTTIEFQRGWFEIQDVGSQLAAQLVHARAGDQVLDYCAGAGGKTLAIADAMGGRGQIHAHDNDAARLSRIHARLRRSAARNVQIAQDAQAMNALAGRMDLVLVDTPCSGSGAWRRRPDRKWRLKPAQLDALMKQQDQILAAATAFVRPGGKLFYVTCSLFDCENSDRIDHFLNHHTNFHSLCLVEEWENTLGLSPELVDFDPRGHITLSPAKTGSDGFFVAALQKTV